MSSAGELIVQAGVGFGAAAIGARATLRATAAASRRALATGLEADRTLRREDQANARRIMLQTVTAELRLNVGTIGTAQACHSFHIPMQHSSLDMAIGELLTLPLGLAIQIEEAVYALRQYNAAAQYRNERVAVGTGAVGTGAADTEIVRLREVAGQKMEVAAVALSQYLAENGGNGAEMRRATLENPRDQRPDDRAPAKSWRMIWKRRGNEWVAAGKKSATSGGSVG